MGSKYCHILFWLALLCSPQSTQDLLPVRQPSDEAWDSPRPIDKSVPPCQTIKPTARDIVRRIYAILPFLDREHQNVQLLQIYRVTINMMSEGSETDLYNREAAFYAAVLTPIVFLQRYRDTWCLLERFHHAIRRFQTFPPGEKRTALKPLQKLRDLNNKIRLFIRHLPGKKPIVVPKVREDDRDKKDIRFLKELIKNLG